MNNYKATYRIERTRAATTVYNTVRALRNDLQAQLEYADYVDDKLLDKMKTYIKAQELLLQIMREEESEVTDHE